ncbi:hypothetical protein HDG38_004091 [Paraburkholderia sp. WSM4177]|nr:hypothetical protein [Paraburkholderia sp. WSM4177]MBB5486060.1 hypothetical protein [Paraburkholderia sp. WSM4180]
MQERWGANATRVHCQCHRRVGQPRRPPNVDFRLTSNQGEFGIESQRGSPGRTR